MKIILLNSPPYAGKDTCAKHYYNYYRDWLDKNVVFERFSAPLKTSFAAILDLDYNEFYEVQYYEDHKEEPIEALNGVSFRQYQINLSEYHFKPLYGENIFAKLLLERIKGYTNKDSVIVIPDSGFKIEIDALEQVIDPKDVLLARVHREGYGFKGDSRSYVYSDKFFSVDLLNNGTVEDFQVKSMSVINQFVTGNHDSTGIGLLTNGGSY